MYDTTVTGSLCESEKTLRKTRVFCLISAQTFEFPCSELPQGRHEILRKKSKHTKVPNVLTSQSHVSVSRLQGPSAGPRFAAVVDVCNWYQYGRRAGCSVIAREVRVSCFFLCIFFISVLRCYISLSSFVVFPQYLFLDFFLLIFSFFSFLFWILAHLLYLCFFCFLSHFLFLCSCFFFHFYLSVYFWFCFAAVFVSVCNITLNLSNSCYCYTGKKSRTNIWRLYCTTAGFSWNAYNVLIEEALVLIEPEGSSHVPCRTKSTSWLLSTSHIVTVK